MNSVVVTAATANKSAFHLLNSNTPVKIILKQTNDTQNSIDSGNNNKNSFDNAIEEQKRIELKLHEKEKNLENFKKLVKKRVNMYKNAERKLNEDKLLAVSKTNTKQKVKIFSTIDNGNGTNATEIHRLGEAKRILASKSTVNSQTQRAQSAIENSKVPLPGGNWSINAINETNQTTVQHAASQQAPQRPLSSSQQSSQTQQNALASKSLPDFVLRSLIDKTLSEQQNAKEYQKRINTTRKVFADLEREKVKKDQQQQNCKSLDYNINSIKIKKEKQRMFEEKQYTKNQGLIVMNERSKSARMSSERVSSPVKLDQPTFEPPNELLNLGNETKRSSIDDRSVKSSANSRLKELNRYIDALKQMVKDKAAKQKIDLPPLCQCNYSNSFWEFNPNNCANNCIFYKNPKEYARALQSLLLTNDVK